MDPYENFRFRVKWEGQYVAGFSRVSALTKSTEFVIHRDGEDPRTRRKSPGQSEYEPIVLERGVSHDSAFEQWANELWDYSDAVGADFRKDVTIDMFNEAGQLVLSYKVFRGWVSEYQALPDLDASANAVAIQHIKLENEGWEQDASLELEDDD